MAADKIMAWIQKWVICLRNLRMLISNLAYRAYENNEFTDLTIICGNSGYQLHKVVLCSQSTVFKAMCTNGFKETSTQTMNLKADDPELVKWMIDAMYYG